MTAGLRTSIELKLMPVVADRLKRFRAWKLEHGRLLARHAVLKEAIDKHLAEIKSLEAERSAVMASVQRLETPTDEPWLLLSELAAQLPED